jgi:DNA (cytosine-5)-methyltransferase 1
MLTFDSLFAGIGGFDLGFERAGMIPVWQVEIDARCRAVTARHWPDAERLKDVREVGANNLLPVDVITFGSPCQDLSVAGKRAGLKGKRSGLFFEAIRIVDELKPAFAVWENVPGALSGHDGRDFRAILAAFRECGARDLAWRTLDTQYFGVAQRRRRVFIVADFGGERAAEILFERAGMSGDSAARGETRGQSARIPARCFKRRGGFGWSGYEEISPTLEAAAHSHEPMNRTPIVVGTISASGAGTARTGNGNELDMIVPDRRGPRRLTPTECERIQGFPDGWTAWGLDEQGRRVEMSDAARYRMLGNAVCVPVAKWIGQRIVEANNE